ncbi:hypothetical protein FBU30_000283 [Linnemannia zychae]|nr:hypothetical protein FBU30_000283 [Linnemannia zychae]
MVTAKDLEYHLSELIYQSLTAMGHEYIDKEYPKGVYLLKDYKQLLSMLSRMPTAFYGMNMQSGAYIAERWAPHALIRSYAKPRRFNTNKSEADSESDLESTYGLEEDIRMQEDEYCGNKLDYDLDIIKDSSIFPYTISNNVISKSAKI